MNKLAIAHVDAHVAGRRVRSEEHQVTGHELRTIDPMPYARLFSGRPWQLHAEQ